MYTPIKISSSKYEMPSPASWMSPASKKSSPASKMSTPAPKMSALKMSAPEMSAPAGEMSSPASQMTVPKSRAASMDSKCTTFSDIIRALDETHDRIASMGVDEIKQDRMDSLYSLLDDGQPKTPARRAFDQKKYLSDYKNGDITLRQIQVAANATKTPEEHRADWIRVNGSECFPFFSHALMILTLLQSFLSPSVATAGAPTTLTLCPPSADAMPSPTTSRMLSRLSRTSSSEAKRYVSDAPSTCQGHVY